MNLGVEHESGHPSKNEGDEAVHVAVMEPMHSDAVTWLRDHGATVTLAYEGQDWRADAERIRAIVVRSFRVDQSVLDELPALEVIGKQGVGVNTIDLEATTARGIKVTNVLGANANSVAEGAVTLLLAALRDLVVCDRATRAGEWWDFRFSLRYMKEFSGTRLGVLGAGRIGKRAAEICKQGFGCDIGFLDPFVEASALEHLQAQAFSTVPELFDWADNVIVAAPLTDHTRGLVDADALSRLGRDGVVVCCSRGGIIDEQALARAARDGVIRGGAIDSFASEPPGTDNPLFSLDQVVVTPHIGGHSDLSRQRVSLAVAHQLWALLNGGDAPVVGREAWL